MTVFHQINNESLIYSKQLALNWLVFSSTKCSRPFLTVRPLQQTWHARPADDLIKFATLPVHDLERLKRHSCRNRNVLRRLGARGVHGNGIPRGNGIPMGFPWEWEWKTHFHGSGNGNGNDFRGSGNDKKYVVQKFPFAIRFRPIILFMYRPIVIFRMRRK